MTGLYYDHSALHERENAIQISTVSVRREYHHAQYDKKACTIKKPITAVKNTCPSPVASETMLSQVYG
ncbi:MAG: hypothetical protein PHO65_02485 [Sulfurovum sp.]|nr:hypothetical protein [Sulfurovum sp.]